MISLTLTKIPRRFLKSILSSRSLSSHGFSKAIVRLPCPSMIDGITSADCGVPDYNLACTQHASYVQALEECGVAVTVLQPDNDFPDSVFVEDTAVMLPGHPVSAILCRPGAPSRLQEAQNMLPTLQAAIKEGTSPEGDSGVIYRIEAPGTIEGGDVMLVQEHFYIGLSARTNENGADQMINFLNEHNGAFGTSFTGSKVPLREMLHLKTGVNSLENGDFLVHGEFAEGGQSNFRKIYETNESHNEPFQSFEVPKEEAYAANSLWVNDSVIVPAGFPSTCTAISDMKGSSMKTRLLDVSEFAKLDGGLSCMSLRFGESAQASRGNDHRLSSSRSFNSGRSSSSAADTIGEELLLPHTNIAFQGVEIDCDALPAVILGDASVFESHLEYTSQLLREAGKTNAFYLKIGPKSAHIVPLAMKHGFRYHNAEGEHALMLLWLPDAPCLVPQFGTHNCGVGAVITINSKEAKHIKPENFAGDCLVDDTYILMVKESSKLYRNWKLPGGYVDLGEGFGEAAMREVFEETGIKTKFLGILGLRHSHKIQRGRSDVYVITRLHADSFDIVADVQEIETCLWMPLTKLREENTHPLMTEILAKLDVTGVGLTEKTLPSAVGREPFQLYTRDP